MAALRTISRLSMLSNVRALQAAPSRSLSSVSPWRRTPVLHLAAQTSFGSRLSPLHASSGSGFSSAAGSQVDSELITTITGKISTALETERVNVVDVNGDGRHIAIDVVSAAFEGKNLVQRQRLVYKAIWLELQDAVHAVDAMTTKTPTEADGV